MNQVDASPFHQLNDFELRTQQALDSLKQRDMAKLAGQKMDYEDQVLAGVTSRLHQGKSLYDPDVMPYATALASTRHAVALPLLEQAAKAGIPKILKTAPGEKLTSVDPRTGLAHDIGTPNPPNVRDEFITRDVGGVPRTFKIGSIPGQEKSVYEIDMGKAYRAGSDPLSTAGIVKAKADSKRNLAKALKDVQDFEFNPNLVSQYQKIISDPAAKAEIGQAAASGDMVSTEAILAKLLGDSTPERVMTKRMMNYMRAVDTVEGEKAYLKELGDPYKEPKKQKPTKAGGF